MEYSGANFFPLYEEIGPQPQKPSYNSFMTSEPKQGKLPQYNPVVGEGPSVAPIQKPAMQSTMMQQQQQQQPMMMQQQPMQPPSAMQQQPKPYQQSYMDKLFSKKKDLSKLLIFALVIAFGISICMVFQSLIKYLKSADKIVTLKQEFWVTVIYSMGLFLTTWIIKTIA